MATNLCLQLLLYVTVATPQERQQFKEYWRHQRKQFIERHIIADDPYDNQDHNDNGDEQK